VAVLPPAAYGGYKDVNEAWAAGVLAVGVGPAAAAAGGDVLAVPQHLQEPWAERVAIMVADGGVPCEEAERLAWEWLQTSRGAVRTTAPAHTLRGTGVPRHCPSGVPQPPSTACRAGSVTGPSSTSATTASGSRTSVASTVRSTRCPALARVITGDALTTQRSGTRRFPEDLRRFLLEGGDPKQAQGGQGLPAREPGDLCCAPPERCGALHTT
jgi:hypothetical protein